MRNIVTLHLSDPSLHTVLNSAEGNEIILLINPLPIQESGYTVTEQASGGISRSSDEVEMENGMLRFNVPFEWYASAGSIQIRLEANEGVSDYVSFTVASNLVSTDEISVKLTNGVFLISKITSGTDTGGDYNDLDNKPSINSVTLIGNKTGTQLSLINTDDTMDEATIDTIVFGGLG